MRVKLVVAYLGTPFFGWQRQRHARTVQGELEQAVQRMSRVNTARVVGAGRTDAGVHASGQAAHVDLADTIPPDAARIALNRALPAEIRVRSVVRVRDEFHARLSARAKHYVYCTSWREPSLPWFGLRAATLPPTTDEAALTAAVALIPGRRDVASFSVPDAVTGSTVRTLYRVWIVRRRHGLHLHFVGDGFLRYQVRRMVGALLEVGWGRRAVDEFATLLAEPTPGARVWTAPARGLTLERVYYRMPPGVGEGIDC